MKTLRELIETIDSVAVTGDPAATINKVEVDSRLIKQGDLFIAITGEKDDGLKYISDAIAKGAIAVVASTEFDAEVPCMVIVKDMRTAVAKIAARYYDYPSKHLKLIGVTGTNGKTTITFLLKSILENRGKPVGVIGTLGYFTGKHSFEAVNTTPGPIELERLFTIMQGEHLRYAVMEVSSHALAMHRVDELAFQVVAINNITQDHFDYHKNFESYREAKARILDLVSGQDKWAILNRDDQSFDYLFSRVKSSYMTYSLSNPKAELRLEDVEMTPTGSSFTLVTPLGTERVNYQLVGKFNLENALCAAACSMAVGLDPWTIAKGLGERSFVMGRAHRVDAGQPFTVLVDYAHTPDALGNILETGRQLTKGRLLVVFGCGGDRDRTKRPLMGQVTSANADIVVCTSDNPRSEDPLAIIEDIKPGLDSRKEIVIEPDRHKAIELALSMCRPNDLLVVAGKGHENYQILGERRIHFDDREIIENYLRGKYN
jgi:UDP-N-acetylmuramoyl-L-alanyl-D-glutamate--2,6-diaminopimelate ligase